MKSEIHPTYQDCTVTCGCGNSFQTQSLNETLHVDVCSACHPFFTGNERVLDSEGRIDRFNKKYAQFAVK